MEKKKVVIVSGGFDPIHPGHTRLFEAAKELGDELIVILNSDEWLIRKKGRYFMDVDQREEVILSIWCIDACYICEEEDDIDDTVCSALKDIKTNIRYKDHIIFANGGDRKSDNVPEVDLCEELGIEMVWNVGGEKAASSSDLLKRWKD